MSTGDGGVLVDASLRTSNPDIYAVGDIAAAEHPLFERADPHRTLGQRAQPARRRGRRHARRRGEYKELPYFFTDQYDLGMEYVGHAPDYDRVVFRGDVDGREFVAFWLDADNRVLAGMNVNVWDVLDDIKNLIRSKAKVNLNALVDPETPLGEVVS